MVEEIKEENLLLPLETYLSAGVHIGTKYRTRHMAPFIFKINPDGLSVMNVQLFDKRLRLAGKFLSKYNPEDIIIVGRRENAWRPIKAFSKVIGAKDYSGRYKAGIMTNANLRDFVEPKIMVVTDPWPDKNAIHDAMLRGIPVIALTDTNNMLNYIDLAIPCNNKGNKSLGVVFWVLANQYLKERGVIAKDKNLEIPIDKFYQE